jgi:hypothetical protein
MGIRFGVLQADSTRAALDRQCQWSLKIKN